MAKTTEGDKRTNSLSLLFTWKTIDLSETCSGVLQKRVILQLQNKLTEFTVLHYNCDHFPMDDHDPMTVDPTY
jgi:hypothetical protein